MVIIFWYYYFINFELLFKQSQIILFTILFMGLVLTVMGGILISLGVKIILKPEFYLVIKEFLKTK